MIKAIHKTCGVRQEIGQTFTQMKEDWDNTWAEAYMYWSYRLLMLFACVSCVMFIIVDSLNLCLRGEGRAGACGQTYVYSASQHHDPERLVARSALRPEVSLGAGQDLPGCMSKD